MDIIDSSVDVEFFVQSLVCTADLEQTLNLHAVSIGLGLQCVKYEPEQFPGLIYRAVGYTAALLLFGNGKVVITGATDIEAAEGAFTHLKNRIERIQSS